MSKGLHFGVSVSDNSSFAQYFREVSFLLQESATKKAVQAACRIIQRSYMGFLPVGSKPAVKFDKVSGGYAPRIRLSQATAFKVWRYPAGDGFAGIIGTTAGTAPHAHLVEDGTEMRYRSAMRGAKPVLNANQMIYQGFRQQSPENRRTGVMPALHPLARAFDSSASAAEEEFGKVLQHEIEKPL